MTVNKLTLPAKENAVQQKINEVIDSLGNYQTTSNLVTSISGLSTDTQYPSAKCVYDAIDAAGGVVDGALDINSVNAVMNKVITEAIADLSANINLEAYLDMIITGNYENLPYIIQSSYNDDLEDVIDGTYSSGGAE